VGVERGLRDAGLVYDPLDAHRPHPFTVEQVAGGG
jgi:hypothetical protein